MAQPGPRETALLPDARAVVVIGNGGSALWEAFTAAVRHDPALAARPHPLDAFVADHLAALPVVAPGRWVRCAADATVQLDFRTLARDAGLGWPSRIGLLLHPVVGPWLGLRLALVTPDPLDATGPLVGPGPCPSCPAPCEPACPVGAVSADGLDAQASWAFRQRDPTCHGGCLARRACPEGAAFAYPPDQDRYHMHGPSRAAVLARLRQADSR